MSASAGVADTTGQIHQQPRIRSRSGIECVRRIYKTYMGSIAITAPESLGAFSSSTLCGGVVNGFNNSVLGSGLGMPTLNAYVGATVATPVVGLRLSIAWDLLSVDTKPHSGPLADTKVEADIWTIAGYASYQLTEKLSLHGRFSTQPAISISQALQGSALSQMVTAFTPRPPLLSMTCGKMLSAVWNFVGITSNTAWPLVEPTRYRRTDS